VAARLVVIFISQAWYMSGRGALIIPATCVLARPADLPGHARIHRALSVLARGASPAAAGQLSHFLIAGSHHTDTLGGAMTSSILVTGGTGTLGRLVVRRLLDVGRDLRVLSRHSHAPGEGIEFVPGDLATGQGIEAAVEGAEVIVHCAGSSKGDEEKARQLVRAASRAQAPHLVFISVVGADRIPVTSSIDRAMFGYFGSKLAAERVVADSGLPWTTLRAAQFYDLLLTVAQQLAKLPVIPVPAGIRFQPVDADEVAARLVELTLGGPAGLVPDMAGPRDYAVADLLRGYLRARGKRRLMVPVRLPGQAARAIRAGANLAPERAVGHRTWEDFLEERVGSPTGRS
jgi:uncharacterized protein YbjT (DUF2867 family)